LEAVPGFGEELGKLLNAIPVPLWHSTPDSRRDFFNSAWLSFTGRKLDEELGDGWLSGLHEEDREEHERRYREAVIAARPFELYVRLRHADGGFRSVLESGAPVFDSKGALTGYVGSLRDLTELRRVQLQLDEASSRYRELRETIPAGLLILEASGSIMGWNRAAERIFGYSADEVIGRNVRLLLPDRHHAALRQKLSDIESSARAEEVATGRLDAKGLRKDGGELYLDVSYSATMSDEGLRLVVLLRDVTAEKKESRMLKQERERYRSFFMASPVPVAILGRDGRIVECNRAFAELLGYRVERLQSMRLWELTHPEDLPALREEEVSFESGRVDHSKSERRFLKSGGDFLWAAVTTDAYRGRSGQIEYLLMEVVDISDIKKMEEELSKQIRELRAQVEGKATELEKVVRTSPETEKLVSIGMSVAQATHDIRNPLTAIDLGLFALENLSPRGDPEEASKIIATMRTAVKQASDIVGELTQFAKTGSLKKVRVSMKELVRESLKSLNIPSTIRVQNEVEAGITVLGDRTELLRVFQNLFKNAVEAMPEGGTLKVWSKLSDGSVVIGVSDTGKGMTQEVLHKIFSPFFTTKEKGMGLGLAIVKKFVTDHGGRVECESEVGKGTTFRVMLPLALEQAQPKTDKTMREARE
jgi:PAS domain S-box-containing protein